mmetsp:Transcript_50275/g.92913  ORF Transcript_50275/g.92913 Transcript_50275/m.92913 type:complete len:325 (-) Transcript_50275:109-1083(-)
MPPRVVICDLCGGKFFPHSIEKHQKVCREKVGVQLHPCPYCGSAVSMLEMDSHILKCSEAKKAGAVPTGQSAALERRLKNNKERQAKGIPPDATDKPLGASSSGNPDMPAEFAESDDVRVECQVCGRKFAFDRVAKHQAICTKINNKKPRRPFEVKRTYNEGGSSGAVIGVSAPPAGKSGRAKVPTGCEANLASKPNPKPIKTHWREESKAFRDACQAGRDYPMPGASSGSRNASSSRQRPSQSRPQNAGFHGKSAGGSSQRAPSNGSQPPKQRQQAATPSSGRPPAGSGLAAARHSRGSPLPEWGSPGARSYGRDCMTGPIRR